MTKACALHADKILDDVKIVKRKYDGKTYSKPRHGKVKCLDQMLQMNHLK